MPLPLCASCGKSNKRAKLLRCLHSVCVGCLEKYLTYLNEVDCPKCGILTPPPRSGKPQFLALPDSYSTVGGEEDRTQVEQGQRLCDECGEDEPAESQCLDCIAFLCQAHAEIHPKSRASLHHRVGRIDLKPSASSPSSNRVPKAAAHCIIHPSYSSKSFCMTCNELVCEKCLSGSQACNKGKTPHTVLSVGEAAERMRSSVKKILTGSVVGNQEDMISQAIDSVDTAISQLHDRTEVVSEEVVEYFSTVSKLLKVREAAILEKLDRLRSAKLLPLEQQKQRLQKNVSSHETVSMLLKTDRDNCDFVRMGGWLEEAAMNMIKSMSGELEPCVTSHLAFRKENAEKLTAAIGDVGDVSDTADVDPRHSSVQLPAVVHVGQEFDISLTLASEDGEAVVAGGTVMTSLQLEVIPPDNKAVSCVASPGDDTGKLTAKYKPTMPGTHVAVAKYGGRHLKGSPADTKAGTDNSGFDPSRHHGDVKLLNNNMTARTNANVNHFQSVCGSDVYRSGAVDIRVRLDNIQNGEIMVFMCNSPSPVLNSFQADRTGFGWYGASGGTDSRFHGGSLGQKWQDGDVIHLSLDCDRHTLTGRHERTGTTETLSGVTGDLYLYVSLLYSGCQVTIL